MPDSWLTENSFWIGTVFTVLLAVFSIGLLREVYLGLKKGFRFVPISKLDELTKRAVLVVLETLIQQAQTEYDYWAAAFIRDCQQPHDEVPMSCMEMNKRSAVVAWLSDVRDKHTGGSNGQNS